MYTDGNGQGKGNELIVNQWIVNVTGIDHLCQHFWGTFLIWTQRANVQKFRFSK